MIRSIDSTVTTSPRASANVTGRLGSASDGAADSGIDDAVVGVSAASTPPQAATSISPTTATAFRIMLGRPNR
jgi:hypothetical protein